MEKKTILDTECEPAIFALRDTMNVLSGKWKLAIIGSILVGKKRFSDIKNNITIITPRMLSKELRELEINGVITRTVTPSFPVVIEYELTESGLLLQDLIEKMIEWGVNHRRLTVEK